MAKDDVRCVELQMRIDSKFDTVVFMKGGSFFIVADSKSEIERKIGGRNERRNTDNEGLPTARPHE